MNPFEPLWPTTPTQKWLLATLVLVSIAFVLLIWPFYGALMWAAILALLCTPLQDRLNRRFGGRSSLAALVTLTGVTLVVILPLLAVAASLARQGATLAAMVQSGQIDVAAYLGRVLSVLPGPAIDLLERFGITDVASIQQRVGQSAGRLGQVLAEQVLNVGQHTLDFLVSLFVAIYIAFFLLRDGRELVDRIGSRIPLDDGAKRELGTRLAAVVRATVKGNMVVALVQGALGGIALAVLGVPAALLWGAVMAALSLLPAVGAALVWAPIALYLVATGELWQGLGLAVFGVVVIGLVDNLLRPVLVGKDARLPDWLVLLSTIGGIALVGINGFVVGPLVASMFIVMWSLHGRKPATTGSPTGLPPS